MFRWTDKDSNILDSLEEFTQSFLVPSMLYDIITKYIIRFGVAGKPNIQKPMIVMRPYQIFAVKAVIDKVTKPLISEKANGYIFHTTGSGKTLTSYKCAQIAADRKEVYKVVFLVDRKDLDDQTVEEFKSIDATKIDLTGDITNTKALLGLFSDIRPSNKLVVTTIQKFSNAIKLAESGNNEFEQVFNYYRDKRVVFIIDECHRTQFGDMHTRIKRFFRQGQYIGFTGTPILEENKGQAGRTTSELFGELLHTYNIKNAIGDGSVLGFSIDYFNTFKGNEKLKKLSDEETTSADRIDSEELFLNPLRIEYVVKKIYEIHDKKTNNRQYTALFAVPSIEALLLYYKEFAKYREKLEKEEEPQMEALRVSAIFTASDSDSDKLETSTYEALNSIIDDYNKEFRTSCNDIDSFRITLSESLKCRRGPHVDIVIVVGIFLTGFDSCKTSTLYVDKNLEYHNLLQAFSRTNRVDSVHKTFGNIVCFRPQLKPKVDAALELFSSGDTSTVAVAKDYKICITVLMDKLKELLKITKENPIISSPETPEKDKREFVIAFREFNKAFKEAKQFTEFDYDKDVAPLLSMDEYNRLVGEQKEIHSQLREHPKELSALLYTDFCMELIAEDKINYEYIQNLINNIDLSSLEGLQKGCRRLQKLVETSTSDSVRNKREMLLSFFERLMKVYEKGEVMTATAVEGLLNRHIAETKIQLIQELSKEANIDEELIRRILYKMIGSGGVAPDIKELSQAVKEGNPDMRMIERRTVIKNISDKITKIYNAYTNI